MISLKQVHYALAVERHLHFRRAAEACNISQSALSTALSEMEKQLGFQIFVRDNRTYADSVVAAARLVAAVYLSTHTHTHTHTHI